MLYTTFRLAKEAGVSCNSYHRFAQHKGGVDKWGGDTPIPLTEVLDVLGLDDALWCLRCTTEPSDRFSRLLACEYAEHVLPVFESYCPEDNRPRCLIEVTRKFADGQATMAELQDAGDAAEAASRAAAWAAAWAAARAAERLWQMEMFRQRLSAE